MSSSFTGGNKIMKMLAIDGNSIMNRAFYGIKLLSNKKGVFTNAVTGFMNIYLKELDIVKPDCIVTAFDLKTPTFRHKAVTSYKANRKGMPEELAQQLPLIKQLLTGLGVTIIECEGYEADDVLGTLSRLCSDNGDKCVVLTGDRDNLQLIGDNVSVRLVTNRETIDYNEKLFIENYGFYPVNLIDLKALMGDSSDNISGVPGVGEKTAMTLIQRFKTIENLYDSIDDAGLTKSVYNKLVSGKEAAVQSKWLATINREAPIGNDPEKFRNSQMDSHAVSVLLTELEMFRLLERFHLKAENLPDESFPETFDDIAPAEKLELSELDASTLCLINKSESVDFLFDTLLCELRLIFEKKIYRTTDKKIILSFFESNTKKRTFDAKPVYRFAFDNSSSLHNIEFDALIAAYLIDSLASDYNLQKLCASYAIPFDKENDENADITAIPALCQKQQKIIEDSGMNELLYQIELPLTEVLASMEHEGIKTDTQGVKQFGENISEDIDECQKKIFELCGKEFNISSPKQLGEVLFNDLGLPAKKKTKSGYSTNAEVLEELRTHHPVIDIILKYRSLTKLRSTYVDGLLKTVEKDSRIHTVFKQTETRTGRISSTEPNMQNIPVRTELGSEMRKFFIADDGKVLLDADYSQIELRIMAHMCGDKNMQQAFIDGTDIHSITASQVFNMPPDMVTASMRSAAKAVNFGIIYGIGAFSLSKDINVTVAQANQYIKNYLNKYPNVEKFMNNTVENAKNTGYVTTLFGRRRNVPELKATNKILQAAGKRIAMNTPIQGTAADIIKIAMVKVYQRLEEEKLNAKLILQVHDELIVEADINDADRASVILSEEMTNAVSLSIPLTADVNRGNRWYDAKG